MLTGLNYGQAIEALKNGKMCAREGWNEKGMFVFMQVPSEISIDIVPKMQSLPPSVKDEFAKRYAEVQEEVKNGVPRTQSSIRYSNQLGIVHIDNTINGWVASSSDTIATDWCILD